MPSDSARNQPTPHSNTVVLRTMAKAETEEAGTKTMATNQRRERERKGAERRDGQRRRRREEMAVRTRLLYGVEDWCAGSACEYSSGEYASGVAVV